MYILNKLGEERSFSSVAHEVQLSVSTVIRVFDLVSYIPPKSLPSVIAIDEFKGNAGDEKYQCILTNPQSGEILDILPTRNSSDLIRYMKKYSLNERKNVKYFVSDMWKPYIAHNVEGCLKTVKQMMSDWILNAQSSQLTEYEKCASTMINWQNGILNSFTVPHTNGFTEGCNNRIKVIKRISYGYRNFRRFRKTK